MSGCMNESRCFVNNNENEAKPMVLGNSIYAFDADNTKTEDAKQLTVWKSANYNHDQDGTACDTNFDGPCGNANAPSTGLNDGRCGCTDAWKKLKQVFELTDKELNAAVALQYAVPGELFCRMPLDFNDDDFGENLVDYRLDGERSFNSIGTQSDGLNTDKRAAASVGNVREMGAVTDEPSAQAVGKKPNADGGAAVRNKTAQPPATDRAKTYSTTDTGKIKNIGDEINSKTANKNRTVRKMAKRSGKRKYKCCRPAEPVNKNEKWGYNLKYVYTYGESYQGGITVGHKNCVDVWIPIPRHKGWISESYINTERKILAEKRLAKLESGRSQEGYDASRDTAAADGEKWTAVQTEKQQAENENESSNSSYDDDDNDDGEITEETIEENNNNNNNNNNTNDKDRAAAAFRLDKNNGIYTITMNRLTSDGHLNTTEDPVVFKLGGLLDREYQSSCSNFDLKFVPPVALDPKKPQRDVYTSYEHEPIPPTAKKNKADAR